MSVEEPCVDHGQKGNGFGYGKKTYKGKQIGAHIVALIEATGEERNGRLALHSCDNPRCINPKHLRWGTHSDNMRDRSERRRSRGGVLVGERNGKSKLSTADVQRIRDLYVPGRTLQKDLAQQFGVSKVQICRILKGSRRSVA
ncbi:hypothetical protein AWB73_01986 [Caballeronia turbans]|nr:hypothetical protein AWB73_01986 [Caballeronia turbans]